MRWQAQRLQLLCPALPVRLTGLAGPLARPVPKLAGVPMVANRTVVATPDDIAAYEACQRGHGAWQVEWQQGYSRGRQAMARGGDARSVELGLAPLTCAAGDFTLGDETVFHGAYREWLRLLKKGVTEVAP